MKKYEGLFILNTAGKEENVKEIVDKITAEIASAGGKIETVQKMEKRNFSRIADKKINSGYYLNVIFDAEGSTVDQLKSRFSLNDDVFRIMFTKAPPAKPAAVAV